MPKQRNAVKAGLFIVVSLALAFAVVIAIKGISGFVEKMQLRRVSFTLQDDLSGLRIGDDVRLGGFKIGDVRSIEIVTGDDPRLAKCPGGVNKDQAYILVSFAMPEKFQLRKGAKIGIQSTVTEKTCLNVSNVGQGDTIAADVPLVGSPSALSSLMTALGESGSKINDILTSAQQSVTNINGMITDIRPRVSGIMDDVRGKTIPNASATLASFKATGDAATELIKQIQGYIKPIVNKYHVLADAGTKMLDQFGGVIGDTKPDLRQTMANLRDATGTIKDELPQIARRVKGLLDNLSGTIDSARTALVQTMENTRDMTGAAKSVIVGNKSRLDNMIRSLGATALNLEYASADLKVRPGGSCTPPRRQRCRTW